MQVLEAARAAQLPDWRLFAGAVHQTVWNAMTGRPADHGIRDYDIGYFEQDMSATAEAGRQASVRACLPAELESAVEVVNQARVHLWFEGHFGRPYRAPDNTDDALRQFLFTSDAVGVRLEADCCLTIAAPYGLRDVFDMVLRPNPDLALIDGHAEKAQAAIARWPELATVGGADG